GMAARRTAAQASPGGSICPASNKRSVAAPVAVLACQRSSACSPKPLSPPRAHPVYCAEPRRFTPVRKRPGWRHRSRLAALHGQSDDDVGQGWLERFLRHYVSSAWSNEIFQKVSAHHVLAPPMGLECPAIEHATHCHR